MARYIFYLEILGYSAVSLVALAVMACFFFQVDDVITGDAVAIKPRTESIKREADALVTRVLVRNHQPVHRGDPLVEVVESPAWMSRYRVIHQVQSLLDEMKARAGGEANEDTAAVLLSAAKQRLADWEAKEAPRSPRVVLRSPIDGVAIVPKDLAFQQFGAGKEILKVADLNDLRLTPKLNNGDTIADARLGQEAIIKAISPDYKNRTTFHGDTVPEGRHFWQKERVTRYSLLDPKIKKIVRDSFKGRKITQRNDIPFALTEVKDVEVDADIETRREESGEKAIQTDAPADLELRGKVIKGKHRLSVQVADLPPAVTRQVGEIVTKQLQGQVLNAPRPPKTEGGAVLLEPLRVEAVRGVQVIAKVKGENTDAAGSTKRLKQEAARTAVQGAPYEKISDARQFEATVQIQNPPQFLKDQVLALMEQGKEVKAKVELKTGRRPVAFLLLKR